MRKIISRTLGWSVLLTLAALGLAACRPISGTAASAGAQEKTLYVGPEMVECVGVAPQTCLLVKEDPDDEYTYFYSPIDGFDYEPGYTYEIRVLVEPVANAPADASSLRYTLIEVVDKQPAEASAAAPSLEGPTWQLESYVDSNGQTVQSVPESAATATFLDGTVSGSGGCNSFSGSYVVEDERLTIGPLGTTLMACPEPLMNQEQAYLAALANTAAYRMVGAQLELLNGEDQVVATFGLLSTPGLTDRVWYATSVNNGMGAVTTLILGTEITAEFGADGRLNGSAGCNTYMTLYVVDGASLDIQPPATTRMFCAEPDGIMEQEAQYLAALSNTAAYTTRGDTLELRAADGALLVGFQAAAE